MKLKLCLSMLVLSVLFGCSTMEGAGKDIEKAGGALKESAREHKK